VIKLVKSFLEEGLRVIDPAVTGVKVDLVRFDLSLANRRATNNAIVNEAADAMRVAGLGSRPPPLPPKSKGTWVVPTLFCVKKSTAP
jgi:hypothetical protein